MLYTAAHKIIKKKHTLSPRKNGTILLRFIFNHYQSLDVSWEKSDPHSRVLPVKTHGNIWLLCENYPDQLFLVGFKSNTFPALDCGDTFKNHHVAGGRFL